MLVGALKEWLPVIAASLAAAAALIGLPIGHGLQARRERALWNLNQRLDAYSALAATSSELAAATGVLGGVLGAMPGVPIEFYVDAQKKWTTAHEAFLPAQFRAALLAEQPLLGVIERMSEVAHEMTDAAQSAGPTVDPSTGKLVREVQPEAPEREALRKLIEPDQEALRTLNELGNEAVRLRNEFLRLSRQELRPAVARGGLKQARDVQ